MSHSALDHIAHFVAEHAPKVLGQLVKYNNSLHQYEDLTIPHNIDPKISYIVSPRGVVIITKELKKSHEN